MWIIIAIMMIIIIKGYKKYRHGKMLHNIVPLHINLF